MTAGLSDLVCSTPCLQIQRCMVTQLLNALHLAHPQTGAGTGHAPKSKVSKQVDKEASKQEHCILVYLPPCLLPQVGRAGFEPATLGLPTTLTFMSPFGCSLDHIFASGLTR